MRIIAALILESSLTLDGGVEGFCGGVVDNSYGWDFVDCEAEGDAGVGEIVDEVYCAVDWVYDECWCVCEGGCWGVGFFAVEAGDSILEPRVRIKVRV